MQQQYVRMARGEVVEGPTLLPYRWTDPTTGNIVALRNLDEAGLNRFGWEPVRMVDLEEEFDEDIHEIHIQPIKVSDGKPTIVRQAQFRPDSRISMLRKIDMEAGRRRLNYISAGAGQEIEYAEKLNEVRELLDRFGENITEEEFDSVRNDFPFTAQDIGVTYTTAREVILNIYGEAMKWAQIGASIARWRRLAKRDIAAAPSEQEAYQIYLERLNA